MGVLGYMYFAEVRQPALITPMMENVVNKVATKHAQTARAKKATQRISIVPPRENVQPLAKTHMSSNFCTTPSLRDTAMMITRIGLSKKLKKKTQKQASAQNNGPRIPRKCFTASPNGACSKQKEGNKKVKYYCPKKDGEDYKCKRYTSVCVPANTTDPKIFGPSDEAVWDSGSWQEEFCKREECPLYSTDGKCGSQNNDTACPWY